MRINTQPFRPCARPCPIRTFPHPPHRGWGGTGVVTMTDDNNLTIRKLTPRECLRLQGYNDDEIDRLTNAVDDKGKPLFPKTRLYFFAGNSVVVDVFAALLGEIVADMAKPSTENRNSLDYWMEASQ